jgi:probable HAF family extracellular repeat protein
MKSFKALICAVLVALAARAASAQTYTITDLGSLGANQPTMAHAINNAGQITGSSNLNAGTSHAFLFSGGTLTDIGSLGGPAAIGFSVNSSGNAVGYSELSSGQYRGFLYSNGAMTQIPTLGSNYGAAFGINDLGQITGQSYTTSGIAAGFIYTSGVISDIGNLGGTDGTYAYAINNAGQIVGYSYNAQGNFLAFLWQNGSMSSIGTLGGDWSQAYAINNSGQITGSAYLKNNLGPHAFTYANGIMTDVDGRSGLLQSWGEGINSSGVIAGRMQVPGGQFVTFHAMVVTGGKMQDLNRLIPAKTGWLLQEATGINDSGQIVGYGTLKKQTHAFLLTPAK